MELKKIIWSERTCQSISKESDVILKYINNNVHIHA
jgi:hypothetical protein